MKLILNITRLTFSVNGFVAVLLLLLLLPLSVTNQVLILLKCGEKNNEPLKIIITELFRVNLNVFYFPTL